MSYEHRKSTAAPGLSPWFQILFAMLLAAVLLFSAWSYWCFIQSPTEHPSPDQLGLPTLSVFSLTALMLLLTPWKKLGLRIKKLGFAEFEHILVTQTEEQASFYAELDDRLIELEEHIHSGDVSSQISESLFGPKRQEIVLEFLEQHKTHAFSPMELYKELLNILGKQQVEFDNTSSVRRTLNALVRDRIIKTKISENGRTLFYLP